MEPIGTTIISSIIDYLKRNDTNYAVLIAGDWGSGKTYFWHNSIVPKILDHTDSKQLMPIYVSLNGHEKPEQVSRKILYAYLQGQTHVDPSLVEKLQGPLSTLAAGFKAFSGFAKPFVDAVSSTMKVDFKPEGFIDFIDFQKIVICFDDLERCKYDNIWGYINDFVEHKKAKVIILANEAKIGMVDKNGGFKEVKEKVVGKTIKFKPDFQKVLDDIIKSCPDDPQAFLNQERDKILEIIRRSKSMNFRILRSALDDYALLYQRGMEFDKDAFLKARHALLLFTLSVAIDLRIGRMQADNIASMRIANMSMALVYRMHEKDSPPPLEPYPLSFIDQYFGSSFEWDQWFPSVIEFLSDGILDIALFQQELARYQDIEIHPLTYLFELGFWKMPEDQFDAKIKTELLTDITDGKIDPALYPRVFIHMNELAKAHLLGCTEYELEQKFMNGLAIIKTVGKYSNEVDDHHELFCKQEEFPDGYKKIKEETQQTISLLKISHTKRTVDELFSLLPGDVDKFVSLLEKPFNEYDRIPIFSKYDMNAIYSKIMQIRSTEIIKLRNAVLRRYKLPQPELSEDFPVLNELGNKILTTVPDASPQTLSSHLLRVLGESLSKLSPEK